MTNTPSYILAMREIEKSDAKTTSDCQHIIRCFCGISERDCWSTIFSNGWIQTHGIFVTINESKRNEWSE